MQRITTATRVPNKFGPGKDGFGDGNPTTGAPSTQLEAAAFDNYQEEISNAIELSGLTLDPADMTQLWQAIGRIANGSGNFVRITGDTMTGKLVAPTLEINVAGFPGGIPFLLLHDPAGGYAHSLWNALGQIYLGAADGNAPVSPWITIGANDTAFPGNIGAINGDVVAGNFNSVGGLYRVFGNPDFYFGRLPDTRWVIMENAAAQMILTPGDNTQFLNNLNAFQSITFDGSSNTAFYGIPGAAAIRFTGTPQPPGTPPQWAGFYQLGLIAAVGELSFNTPPYPEGGGAWTCLFNGNTTQIGTMTAAGSTFPSDAGLKTNTRDWSPGLDVVRQINTIEFEYTKEARFGEQGVKYQGVTAQELLAVLPEAVSIIKRHVGPAPSLEQPTPHDYVPEYEEVLTVNHSTIFFACLNAIKELDARLNAIESGSGPATPLPA